MKFPATRALALPLLVAGLLLSACGQKGALTLPDTSSATPIIIREAQAPAPAGTPASAPAAMPTTVPTNPPPQR